MHRHAQNVALIFLALIFLQLLLIQDHVLHLLMQVSHVIRGDDHLAKYYRY